MQAARLQARLQADCVRGSCRHHLLPVANLYTEPVLMAGASTHGSLPKTSCHPPRPPRVPRHGPPPRMGWAVPPCGAGGCSLVMGCPPGWAVPPRSAGGCSLVTGRPPGRAQPALPAMRAGECSLVTGCPPGWARLSLLRAQLQRVGQAGQEHRHHTGCGGRKQPWVTEEGQNPAPQPRSSDPSQGSSTSHWGAPPPLPPLEGGTWGQKACPPRAPAARALAGHKGTLILPTAPCGRHCYLPFYRTAL